jgi:uncharacterized protein YwqG
LTPHLFGLLCAAVVLAIVFRRPVRFWLWRRKRDREWKARNAEWQEKFEAENPVGEPFSDAEIAEFKDWTAERALACIPLTPDPEASPGERGTYIGGPAWLAPDQPWPTDGGGTPMEFVAQIDFATLPALPDFPERGVLQLFVQQADNHGADFDDPRRSVLTALWHPDPASGRIAVAQPEESDSVSPFRSSARRQGVALEPGAIEAMEPTDLDWLTDQRLHGHLRRPGFDRIEDFLYAKDRFAPLRHQIGGHPVFVQQDFREPGFADDYDRVLLRLTSDEHLQWGDVGEANFLISAQDLRERDFSRVAFTWDCS